MEKPKNKAKLSWRDLKSGDASSKKRPVSARARMRSFGFYFKRAAALGVLGALGWGSYYIYQSGVIQDAFTPASGAVKRFEFKTDGAISAKWAYDYLGIPRGSALSDVNIFFVKELFEGISQVREADISRIYPETLRVEISEYKPIARIGVRIDSRIEFFMMSREGKFFKPVCIPDEVVTKLPAVTGIRMIFTADGPMDYPQAEAFAKLLDAASEKLPDHFATWKSINLSELSSLTMPLITVKTQDGVLIIFAGKDYEKQLDRLEYILRYAKEKSLINIEQIDLSLSDRADVKLLD